MVGCTGNRGAACNKARHYSIVLALVVVVVLLDVVCGCLLAFGWEPAPSGFGWEIRGE